MKMNPEVKAKWVEALRSGKYLQGKHSLRTVDDKFCCLGVFCDVIDPTAWHDHDLDAKPSATRWSIGMKDGGEIPEKNFPTLPFRIAAGWPLDCSDPDVCVNLSTDDPQSSHMHSLSALNDSGQFTFNEIADLIEEQL